VFSVAITPFSSFSFFEIDAGSPLGVLVNQGSFEVDRGHVL
jgi:hypothetical protein